MVRGPNTYRALELITSMNPGKTVDDLLIFPEPIAAATFLTLFLPGRGVEESAPISLPIDTKTIGAWPSRR
jgi:hypothetical protein